jgi:putative intracellular protease/amidase
MAKTQQVCTPRKREAYFVDSSYCLETAVPYRAFKKAGFEVHFATENGSAPQGDKKMLEGITQKLLVRNDPHAQTDFTPLKLLFIYHLRGPPKMP